MSTPTLPAPLGLPQRGLRGVSTSLAPDPTLAEREISLMLGTPDGQPLRGFKYFWGQIVTGFDDRHHCLKCLKGKRVRAVTRRWVAGEPGRITVSMPEGALLYICGVEQYYTWESNFHLALRPAAGARVNAATFNGCTLHVLGAEQLEIPAEPAAAQYPGRDASFLTCRNFQFASRYFPK